MVSHISHGTRLLDGNSGRSVVSEDGEMSRSDTGESILSDFRMLLPGARTSHVVNPDKENQASRRARVFLLTWGFVKINLNDTNHVSREGS